MKKIIFFSQLYYPDPATTALLMTDLAEDLASYGVAVCVICTQSAYIMKTNAPKRETKNGVAIKRIWSPRFNKNSNIGRIANGICCFLGMLPALLLCDRKALLIFNTNPALLCLLGPLAVLVKRQRYLVLVHDLWPELPANIGMIKKEGFLYRTIDCLMSLSFRYAQGVIVLSEAMARRIADKIPANKKAIRVIPNWADARRVYPVAPDKNTRLQELRLQEQQIVMYSGNMGRYQPLEVIIRAAGELRDRRDILFLFAGEGAKKKPLQKLASSLNLQNVIFIPFQPVEKLAASLSMACISIVGISPENEGVIFPSKLYSLFAVGRPIICISSPGSEVALCVQKAKAGLQASVDDPKDLVAKIKRLIDNPQEAQKMGENGIAFFRNSCERKLITSRWRDMLEKLDSGT